MRPVSHAVVADFASWLASDGITAARNGQIGVRTDTRIDYRYANARPLLPLERTAPAPNAVLICGDDRRKRDALSVRQCAVRSVHAPKAADRRLDIEAFHG